MEKPSETEEEPSQSHSHSQDSSSTSSQDHQNWITLRVKNSTFPKFKFLSFFSFTNWSGSHPVFSRAQDILREKLITEDSFPWKLLPTTTGTTTNTSSQEEEEGLRYVGGVDISFSKDDPSMACGTLVVLDFHTLQVVYQDFSLVNLRVPYVPGFLAFREVSTQFILR